MEKKLNKSAWITKRMWAIHKESNKTISLVDAKEIATQEIENPAVQLPVEPIITKKEVNDWIMDTIDPIEDDQAPEYSNDEVQVDVTALSDAELVQLIQEVDYLLIERQNPDILLQRLLQLAEECEIDPKLVVIKAKKGLSRKAAKAKYFNPFIPSQTWNGRGRGQPSWIKELLTQGHTLDSLLINN